MAQITVETLETNKVTGTDYYVFILNNGLLSEIHTNYTGTIHSSGEIWAYTEYDECVNKYIELIGLMG